MKKYLPILCLILIIGIIVPQITFAKWWNPFTWFSSWSWFKKSVPQTQEVRTVTPTNFVDIPEINQNQNTTSNIPIAPQDIYTTKQSQPTSTPKIKNVLPPVVKNNPPLVTQNTQQITQGTSSPIISSSTPICKPYWQCGDWSTCTDNQKTGYTQTRECSDTYRCGINEGKPNETQACVIVHGSLNVSVAPSSPGGSALPSSWLTLAKFDLTAVEQKFEISQMRLGINRDPGDQSLDDIIVKVSDSGETYQRISAGTSHLQGTHYLNGNSYSDVAFIRLSPTIVVNTGQTKTIEIIGSVPSSKELHLGNYTALVGGFYGKRYTTDDLRYTTNDFATLPNSTNLYRANTLSVDNIGLAVTKSNNFSDTNVLAGSSNVEIGRFILQTTPVGDVNLDLIRLKITNPQNLKKIYIKIDGAKSSDVIAPFIKDGDVVVPSKDVVSFSERKKIMKSQPVVVSVYGDFTSTASGTNVVSITTVGYEGTKSSPSGVVVGQTITILPNNSE